MSRISPWWRGVALAVVVKGVEVGWRPILSMEISCSYCWCHPLVVCKKCYQCLPAGFCVVTISPVCVHEPSKNAGY